MRTGPVVRVGSAWSKERIRSTRVACIAAGTWPAFASGAIASARAATSAIHRRGG